MLCAFVNRTFFMPKEKCTRTSCLGLPTHSHISGNSTYRGTTSLGKMTWSCKLICQCYPVERLIVGNESDVKPVVPDQPKNSRDVLPRSLYDELNKGSGCQMHTKLQNQNCTINMYS